MTATDDRLNSDKATGTDAYKQEAISKEEDNNRSHIQINMQSKDGTVHDTGAIANENTKDQDPVATATKSRSSCSSDREIENENENDDDNTNTDLDRTPSQSRKLGRKKRIIVMAALSVSIYKVT